MTTISATLHTKIERRAKRAWRRHEDGSKKKIHRIKDVTNDELKYRLPDTPDYYETEWIRVLQKDDGTIEVDPKTTGLIECKTVDDLKQLKKHGGEVRAYVLTESVMKIGFNNPTKGVKLKSREQVVKGAKPRDLAYEVELQADDIDYHGSDHFTATEFKVVSELDQEQDLGFTVGTLLDLRTNDDVKKLKRYIGKVRAYKYTDKDGKSPVRSATAILYEPGKDYEEKNAVTDASRDCAAGINVASVEWCKGYVEGEHRAFAFEFDSSDIAAVPTVNAGKLRVFRCKCIEELDIRKFEPIKVSKVSPIAKKALDRGIIERSDSPGDVEFGTPKEKRGLFDQLLGRGEDKED